MTVGEAIAKLEAFIERNDKKDTVIARRVLRSVKYNNKVYPWMETEIKYLKVQSIKGAHVGVCDAGVAAESRYNGTGGEDDISFGHAVQAYERG